MKGAPDLPPSRYRQANEMTLQRPQQQGWISIGIQPCFHLQDAGSGWPREVDRIMDEEPLFDWIQIGESAAAVDRYSFIPTNVAI